MFPLPSKSSQDANINTSGTSSSSSLTTPPELEQTLQMLSSHRTVLGYLLLSRSTPIRIIRYSGVVFDGEQGRRYARAIGKIVEAVRSGLEEISGDGDGVSVFFFCVIVLARLNVRSVRPRSPCRMKHVSCAYVQNVTNSLFHLVRSNARISIQENQCTNGFTQLFPLFSVRNR